MKTFILSTCLMVITIQSSAQVYVVHVDTSVEFQHAASVTTLFAMNNDLITYTGGGVTSIDYTFDLGKMLCSVSAFNGDGGTFSIVNISDSSEYFNLEVITENKNRAHVLVDKGKESSEGIVMYVRWNKMVDSKPTTCGWASRNVVVTRIDD